MTQCGLRRSGLAILILAVIGGLAGGGVWLVVEAGRTFQVIREQRTRQHAMAYACRLVATYVERSGYTTWPRSWEDLLGQAEAGGYAEGWSPAAPRLENLVVIDFTVDLKAVQKQEATEFTAVQPTAGAHSGSVMGEVQLLLARIRGPVEWKDPERNGVQ